MFLNAGYYRAHMYTTVPAQVRADMRRIRDAGSDAVTVSILEQDLFAAVENLHIIEAIATEAGLKLYADIARWGGLVSGTPKVPSLWASTRPHVWKRDPEGNPVTSFGPFAPVASIFHPETLEFFQNHLEAMMDLIPFDGIFWNEPKAVHHGDYSEPARAWFDERGLSIDDPQAQVRAHVDFFGSLNRFLLEIKPDLDICCFMTPDAIDAEHAAAFAAMPGLRTFGSDGRPWHLVDDGAGLSYVGKSLLDHGPGFVLLAREAGLRTFGFMENIDIPDAYLGILDRRMPEVLSMALDHLLYYYYGRSVESPDACMEIVFRHFREQQASSDGA